MNRPRTPFTTSQLIPQEETLEIARAKGELFIGLPREAYFQERRICLTPDAVKTIVNNGHRILIEKDAGLEAGYTDREYSEAGANITNNRNEVFECPIILKVEPPTLDELKLIKPRSVIISALQLKTRKKAYFEALEKRKLTAMAFEFIKDEANSFSLVRALSEIAGTASILIASELMSNQKNGSGLLFGNISGVSPVEVVVIGAGTVGEYAVKTALGLGANVRVFDSSVTKLRRIQNNVGRFLHTSTLQPNNLLEAIKKCDIAVGAIRGMNRSPIIVTEDSVRKMKKGSIIIDVCVDMGGCFETTEMTSHENPFFIKHDVIHYVVPNIPARYPRSASLTISNIFSPYLLKIAENGGFENAIRMDEGLKNGLYFYHGILTNKTIADWFDIPYNDLNLLIF
ncbi:MAG: alanine dehydrogenase [Bacteroidetes bacterium]|nr:alanine dehydrogenase [Bacteroidota bacterium]